MRAASQGGLKRRNETKAADKADIPVFLKDNLKSLIFKDYISGQFALDRGFLDWEGELRQELPK